MSSREGQALIDGRQFLPNSLKNHTNFSSMNRITSQTSLQAAAVIREASQFEDVQITVSWSGNIREANAIERVIYGVVDFFDADASTRRMSEARHAVETKLYNEWSMLAGPMNGNACVAPEEIKQAMTTVTNELITQGIISNQEIPASLCSTLQHIKSIQEASDVSRQLIFQAVIEQRKNQQEVSIDAAKNIATNAQLWKKSLNISSRDAFRLASNAWKLYEKKKILPEEGKEILLCSGRLISRHGFSKEDALSYAIDLHAALKNLGIRMDSVERVMKSLDQAVLELRKQTERVRISAAIRYLQLQDKTYGNVNPIEEIRRGLHDLIFLQQAMPKGCVIDQIHQGAHIRGLSKHRFPEPSPTIDNDKSLTESEKALTDCANSLMSAKLLGSTINSVHGVLLPEVFATFDKQHVEDLVRGNQFELHTEQKIDTDFSQIEAERRKNPKTFSLKRYKQWAEKRIDWAGSARAAEMISHLESQTLFADVIEFSLKEFKNQQQYLVTASGINDLASTSFQSHRKTSDSLVDQFSLNQSHYTNAARLLAQPDAMAQPNAGELFERPVIKIPLMPNPGPDKKAGANGFAVKRSVTLSLVVPRPAEIPATCRITEVSEEWDLMVDWDDWMTMRPEVGTL